MPYDPNFTLDLTNRPEAVNFLIEQGHHAATVVIMSNVELVNAYHSHATKANDVQRATAAAIAAVMEAIRPEAVRAIVREEVAALQPRQIEIVTPAATVQIDDPLHYRTPFVMQILALGDAVMLVGPAGSGKTTIGEHCAKGLGLSFSITSTINDTHELMGFVDGHGTYHPTPFRHAFQHGGLWIADEIDAWDASALLAANSALANGFASFPDCQTPVVRHSDFRMVATANTFGTGADRVYVGRNELDAASLDRFAVIEIDYDLDLERMFAGSNDAWLEHVWDVRKAVAANKIRHVVSSRAISKGSRALSAGLDWDDVNETYLMKGMSAKDRGKVQ